MDVAETAAQVVPYITAAIGAYGTAVWTKAQDTMADETVSWGRRLLQRLGDRPQSRPALEAAVTDLAADVTDEDAAAALRVQIKKALAADPTLMSDITAMVNAAPVIAGPGSQIISGSHIGGDVTQIGAARDVDIRRT